MDVKISAQRLGAVFSALDSISVSGYQNVLNLAAAMQLLMEERQELANEANATASPQ